MANANIKAVITADDRASSKIQGVGSSFGKLSAAMAVGTLAANAFQKGLDLITSTVKESAGAAFNQVRQVENATFALKAYETNGDKVNKVLKDLIAYARSDMGVLFQREDLFAAASTLKLYGQTTETLTDKVKILSKGVSLGKTSFQELSSIVGRAAAKGKLDATDFDMLIERGIGLDKSFRGATVTSESLFEALDKALPAKLLEGRAKSIDGSFIRLKSALRTFGGEIIGVDKETSTFIKGGLGDRFMGAIQDLTAAIPQMTLELKNLLSQLVEIGRQVFDFLQPSLQALWNTINSDLLPMLKRLYEEVLKPLAPFLGQVLVGYIWLAINAINLWFSSVSALYNILMTAKNFLVSTFSPAIQAVANFIVEKFNWVRDNAIKAIGGMLAFIATLPIMMPLYMAAAVSGMIHRITSVNWLHVFSGIWQAMQRAWDIVTGIVVGAWHRIHAMPWGALITGIGRSFANGLIGLIEGALRGALKGLPGNLENKINLPRFANGTDFAPGGAAIVGERGAEIVNLPRGSQVIPNNQIGGGGGNISVNVNVGMYAGSEMEKRKVAEALFEALKDAAGARNTTVSKLMGV